MQSLDVISVNIWDILISLANLVILFLLVKKFLYAPVKKVMAERQEAIDAQLSSAEQAERTAIENRDLYAKKLAGAAAEADSIIHDATVSANRRGEKIVAEARDKAEQIVRQGEIEAAMEKKKAQESIRREITDVSAALTEKLLQREMNTGDHRGLIDDFLKRVGEEQ